MAKNPKCQDVANDADLELFRAALLHDQSSFPAAPWWQAGCVNLTDRSMLVQLYARRVPEGMTAFRERSGQWVVDGVVRADSAELCLSMPVLEDVLGKSRLAVPSVLALPAVDGPPEGIGPSWCGEDGVLIDEAFEPVNVHGSTFARKYVWLLHQLQGLKWCYPYVRSECDVLYFRWNGGRGAVASMSPMFEEQNDGVECA